MQTFITLLSQIGVYCVHEIGNRHIFMIIILRTTYFQIKEEALSIIFGIPKFNMAIF